MLNLSSNTLILGDNTFNLNHIPLTLVIPFINGQNNLFNLLSHALYELLDILAQDLNKLVSVWCIQPLFLLNQVYISIDLIVQITHLAMDILQSLID